MRRRIVVAAGAALLTASLAATDAPPGGTSFGQTGPSYIAPLPPLAPRSQKECDDLESAWQAIRRSVAAEHSACLDSVKDQPCPSDRDTGCTCVTCAPYHDSSSLGDTDVTACRTAVADYERRQAEAERLAREREAEARRRAEWDRQQAADAARKRQDEIARQQAEENRRREEAQRREDRETEGLKKLAEASAEHQQAYARLREAREQEREQLVAAQGAAANKFAQTLSDAQDAARRWQDRFQAALHDSTTASSRTTAQSNIDDFALGGESSDPGNRAVDALTSLAKSVVPFAGIPIAILKNSYHADVAAIDELGYALEHFDSADPAFVAGILDRYGDRVLGPRAMMHVFVDEVAMPIGAQASNPFQEHLADLGKDASARAVRAWKTGDIRELVREGTPPASRLPLVRYWWTQDTPTEPVWHTDGRGVVLLADGENRIFGMDAASGLVSYKPADVERLVAENGLHLVRRGPDPPWVDHVAVVVAPTIEMEDPRSWMDDFAPWLATAEAIGEGTGADDRVKQWFRAYRAPAK